jgi:peroxin-12
VRLANKYFNEFYGLFLFVLENHSLKRYGGSFSENFYGLKRVPLSDKASRVKSLLFLVVLPYVRDKLDELHERLQHAAPRQKQMWTQIFFRFYPRFKSILNAVSLFFQVAYAFSYTTIPSLALFLARVRLERLSPDDLAAFETLPLHLKQSGILSRLWRIILSIPSVFGRMLSYGLFLVQFLEYFYSSDLSQQFSLEKPKPSAPPHPYKKVPETYVLSLDVDKCPICYKRRENDTALSVSGYVFCFKCINDYVRRERQCPVTYIPATREQLIRLYRDRA